MLGTGGTTFFTISKKLRNVSVLLYLPMMEKLLLNSLIIPCYSRHKTRYVNRVSHKRVGHPSVGPLQISDETLTDDPVTMAETIAPSFGSVYLQSVPPPPNDSCSAPVVT